MSDSHKYEPDHNDSTVPPFFPFPDILLPSSRLCASAKVISSIDSYHQLVNWSITPAPHLLKASLINYCPPRGWEWAGCQQEFFRLRWVFIVFFPWSVRAHQLLSIDAEFRETKIGWCLFTHTRHVPRTVYDLYCMNVASVFASSPLALTLRCVPYYLEASDNLWNGNEIPKSNLHFLDKLHWHSDLFYSLATWRRQRWRQKQTREGFFPLCTI